MEEALDVSDDTPLDVLVAEDLGSIAAAVRLDFYLALRNAPTYSAVDRAVLGQLEALVRMVEQRHPMVVDLAPVRFNFGETYEQDPTLAMQLLDQLLSKPTNVLARVRRLEGTAEMPQGDCTQNHCVFCGFMSF